MKKDHYNFNDDEYNHVIKLLKDLPKINAPENFQYNLNVKIENQHFDLNTKEFQPILPWKFVVPASSAVAMVVLFFTFFVESENLENPFHIQPKLRNEITSNIFEANQSSDKLGNNKISENDVIVKNELKNNEVQSLPSSISSEENVIAEFPFDASKSTNLDDIIGDDGSKTNISKRANLVGRSNNNSSFNGFFIREEINKEEFEALKARNDSLVKAFRERKINNRY